MLEKIQKIIKIRMNYLSKNENDFFKGNETFFEEIIKEIKEAKDEVKENNSVYLEDELGDILWDYLCLIEVLKKEAKIESFEKVLERCYTKFSGRLNEKTGEPNGNWQEIKKEQKEKLKKEHEKKYLENF